jgi:hypothetical protein
MSRILKGDVLKTCKQVIAFRSASPPLLRGVLKARGLFLKGIEIVLLTLGV